MGKTTDADELLFASYSRQTSAKGMFFFYANALIVSLAPIYLFYGVYQMQVADSWIIWAISCVSTTYFLTMSCKNQKWLLKQKLMAQREQAVDREINAKYANDKKMSVKEKRERAIFLRCEVAENESTYFAIFYTNILFLTIMMFLGFFWLNNVTPIFKLLVATTGSAALVAFLSSAKN